MLKIIPRHEFEGLAKTHHKGQKLRKMTRWAQFVALMLGHVANRSSLRDIVANMSAQTNKLYHLGTDRVARTSLSRVNEQQPYTLFEALFGRLLTRCQAMAPKHGFRFKNKLYSMDATTIDLCLSVFPWANFRSTKGAIKLHVGLDHDGYLPAFMTVTDGKTQEINPARTIKLPKGSIVVFDRAYTDYRWYNSLNKQDVFFVTRQKSHATYRVTERRQASRNQGVICDQTIRITGVRADYYPSSMRRIAFRDPETNQCYTFITNNFQLSARTIADIYKSRWQIELFFKWIKQNLKVKTFLGTSKNAVLTQLWIALCAYLLLSYIKFCNGIQMTLQKILQLLQLNLFERRDLLALLGSDPPESQDAPIQAKLKFS